MKAQSSQAMERKEAVVSSVDQRILWSISSINAKVSSEREIRIKVVILIRFKGLHNLVRMACQSQMLFCKSLINNDLKIKLRIPMGETWWSVPNFGRYAR